MRVVPLRLHRGNDLRRVLEGGPPAHGHRLVVGLLPEWDFRRELDPATGWAELVIQAQQDP
ncbi:MAG: hypothetical protein ACH34U_07175 [Cyanobium sp.]|jgi:hypothetical protein